MIKYGFQIPLYLSKNTILDNSCTWFAYTFCWLVKNFLASWKEVPYQCTNYVQSNRHLKDIVPWTWQFNKIVGMIRKLRLKQINEWKWMNIIGVLVLPRCRIYPVAAVPKTPARTPAVFDKPNSTPCRLKHSSWLK